MAPRDPLAEVSIRYQTVKSTLEWSSLGEADHEDHEERRERESGERAADATGGGPTWRGAPRGRPGRRGPGRRGAAIQITSSRTERAAERGGGLGRRRGPDPARRGGGRSIHPSSAGRDREHDRQAGDGAEARVGGNRGRPGGRPRQQPAEGQQVGGGEGGEEGDRPQADGAQAGAERHAGPPLARDDVERAHQDRQEQEQEREAGDGGPQELAREGAGCRRPRAPCPPRPAPPAGRWPSWRPSRGGRPWLAALAQRRLGAGRERHGGQPGRDRGALLAEGLGHRPGAGAGRRATAGRRRARRRARPSGPRCARDPGPARRCGRRVQTCTRSPLASPGASRTIAAVSGNDEKRLRNQRSPALPRVLPSVETKRWGRWWRVVPDAWARRSSTAVEVVPADTPGGVSRGATTRMPPRGVRCRRPGARRRRSGDPPARRRRAPAGPGPRPLPARAGDLRQLPLHPAGGRRSCAEPGGRSGAMAASWLESSSVPWPSMVEGRLASGPASGVCRVRSATTSATPATSQAVR